MPDISGELYALAPVYGHQHRNERQRISDLPPISTNNDIELDFMLGDAPSSRTEPVINAKVRELVDHVTWLEKELLSAHAYIEALCKRTGVFWQPRPTQTPTKPTPTSRSPRRVEILGDES